MKLLYKQPRKTADISSARGTAGRELRQLLLLAAILLVGLYFFIGFAVDWAVAHISHESEARIFKHLQVPGQETESGEYQSYIARADAILTRLKSHSTVPPLPYRLALIANDQPNAFAFPGGSIAVTKGLMDVLPEDIGVAFVLGHELGHFYHRDHLHGLGRAIGMRVIMALVFGSGAGAESFGDMIGHIFERSFSQERELMADRYGLELVHALYGDVDGVQRLFQILLEQHQLPEWAYMFATHPSPKERISELKGYAERIAENEK